MKASDLFVRALEAEGVEWVFGIPGEENLDLLESLRTSKIKLILTRHEQAAGFMAATYGRLTGKTGVCLATLGPGATNFVTCAAYAQLGAMPMLMITGQKPVKLEQAGPLPDPRRGRHDGADHEVHQADRLRPTTSRPGCARPSAAPRRKARRRSISNCPRTSPTSRPTPADSGQPHRGGRLPRTRRSPAVDAIRGKVQPSAAVIGAGANRKLTSKMLNEFVRRLGIPSSPPRWARAWWTRPRCSGLRRAVGRRLRPSRDRAADCIINVGHDVIEKPPFFMKPKAAAPSSTSTSSAPRSIRSTSRRSR
jgi:acetolactate synthase I/II/III large subunit